MRCLRLGLRRSVNGLIYRASSQGVCPEDAGSVADRAFPTFSSAFDSGAPDFSDITPQTHESIAKQHSGIFYYLGQPSRILGLPLPLPRGLVLSPSHRPRPRLGQDSNPNRRLLCRRGNTRSREMQWHAGYQITMQLVVASLHRAVLSRLLTNVKSDEYLIGGT